MARKTKAESATAGVKGPNLKQMMKPTLDINSRENDSKNTKRCGFSSASVRPEDTETANAAANVSAEPVDSIQPAEPRESIAVPSPVELPEWNGRRRRTACSERVFWQYTVRTGPRAEDFIPSKWASISVDELVAVTTLVQMKNDLNYQSAPVHKKTRSPRRNLTRQGRRS